MERGEILRALARHKVELIIVGGTAAVLNGAPVHTFDLDIIYARSDENVARLLLALADLDAVFRDDPRRIVPAQSHLRSADHKHLATKHGPLDVLGTVEESTTYEDLLPHAQWLEVSGVPVRVLSLDRLITIKEKLTRPKDLAMLPLLRATLDEQQKAKSPAALLVELAGSGQDDRIDGSRSVDDYL